jgi:hypothetical protein
MRGNEAVCGVIAKERRKERALKSVGINSDSNDCICGEMKTKNKDMLRANFASPSLALIVAKKVKRSVCWNAPADRIMGCAGVAEFEVE